MSEKPKKRKFVVTLSNDTFQALRDALEEVESHDLKDETDATIVKQLFRVGDADVRVFVTVEEVKDEGKY